VKILSTRSKNITQVHSTINGKRFDVLIEIVKKELGRKETFFSKNNSFISSARIFL